MALTKITSDAITADAVVGAKIADNAINSEHYTDESIDLVHMSSDSVNESKLNVSNAGTNGQFLQKQSGNTGGLTWADAGSSVGGSTGVDFNDTVKARFGTDNDLEIYHDGSHSFIADQGTGQLTIKSNGAGIELQKGDTEFMGRFITDGAVQLYYDNAKKFETTATGAAISFSSDNSTVPEGLFLNNTAANTGDNVSIAFSTDSGNRKKSAISHVDTGNYGHGDIVFSVDPDADDGELDIVAHEKLRIKSGGDVKIPDGGKFVCGTGDDFKIYHDGSNSFIDDAGTGNLVLRSSTFTVESAPGDGTTGARFVADGAVELNHNGTKKFETTSSGIKVQGRFEVENASATHYLKTSVDSWHTQFINSNSSSPYGIEVKYTGIARDNNVSEFINCLDTSSVRFKVASDGDVWNHDDSYGGSDQTLKENIVDASSKLEDLKKLKVRNFNWKSEYFPEKSKKKMIGFIAQEVEEVFPSMVAEYNLTGDKDNPVMKKAIKKSWAPILVKALQEATAKIETLEAKVAALEAG